MNFADIIRSQFPFEPTLQQIEAISKIAAFVKHPDPERVFVLRGYAGTGKTTLMSALVKALPHIRYKYELLAPTGRAAKVLASYARSRAWTIHKKIYRPASNPESGGAYALQGNPHIDTLFIIDEASMIGEGGNEAGLFPHSLLEDLFHYVYTGENCRILFVGDSAQLPPVGLAKSPALNADYLYTSFGFPVEALELREVVRQQLDSGVLLNATNLRIDIAEEKGQTPKFVTHNYPDFIRLDGADLQDVLEQTYQKYGFDETIVITRSNKRANIWNQQIRIRIKWQEDELSPGDRLMVVKNNYFWLPKESRAGFIANGDSVEVVRIGKSYELHGFRFSDVIVRMIDEPDEPEFDARILLDTLHSEAPALNQTQQRQLFESVAADYAHLPTKRDRFLKMKEDPFYNALQVKFAYAVTCHKAQGGQWKAVFVEQGYLTDEMINTEFLRWLYTAITRTTEQVYLIGFKDDFFET